MPRRWSMAEPPDLTVWDNDVHATDVAASVVGAAGDPASTAEGAINPPDGQAGELTSISRKAGRGLKWALFGSLITRAGSFGMSLILVRLLAPHDFGLYAVALAATSFA